jgi:hypothetical protein
MFGSFWVHSQFFDVTRVSNRDLTNAEKQGCLSKRTALGLTTVNAELSAHTALRMTGHENANERVVVQIMNLFGN